MMTLQTVILTWIALFLALIVSVLLSIMIFKARKRSEEQSILRADIGLDLKKKNVKDASDKIFKNRESRYKRYQMYLSKKGVNYMFGRTIDPVEWVMAKLLSALLLGVALWLLSGSLIVIAVGMVAGFKLPDIVINASNNHDNKMMLNDVKLLLETLKLKTESGVFLTDTLNRCYRVVSSSRLKKALLEFTTEVKVKNDVTAALSNFEMKFDNKYIINFAGVIRLSFESGDSLNAIDNISKQMTAVQKALDVEEQTKLDAKIQFVQVIILLEIMIIVAYGMLRFCTETFSLISI